MIICTNKYHNTAITVKNEDIKFVNGKTEVSEELASFILENYKEDFWEEGKKPFKKKEIKEVAGLDDAKVEIQTLTSKLNVAAQKNDELLDKLKVSEQAINDWKDLCDQQKDQIKALEDAKRDPNAKVSEEDIKTILTLKDQKVSELTDFCEKAELPKEEWAELNKENLIIYVAKKALNG
jgi:hypothetical protein